MYTYIHMHTHIFKNTYLYTHIYTYIGINERGNRMSPSVVQRLMSTIVHPILQVLYTSPLETVMADQLVKPVLSIVNTLRQISALSPIENQSLLSALIRSILRMGGGREAASSSPLYRGFLYSCITRVLHSSLSTSLEDQTGQESEEGKGTNIL
jgi:hypothetical protein